jgi:hypothetical protein
MCFDPDRGHLENRRISSFPVKGSHTIIHSATIVSAQIANGCDPVIIIVSALPIASIDMRDVDLLLLNIDIRLRTAEINSSTIHRHLLDN